MFRCLFSEGCSNLPPVALKSIRMWPSILRPPPRPDLDSLSFSSGRIRPESTKGSVKAAISKIYMDKTISQCTFESPGHSFRKCVGEGEAEKTVAAEVGWASTWIPGREWGVFSIKHMALTTLAFTPDGRTKHQKINTKLLLRPFGSDLKLNLSRNPSERLRNSSAKKHSAADLYNTLQ